MTYRRLLAANPDFRRLWTGQVVSEVGDWFNNIAVLALTIQLAGPGREGQAVALYAISRHLPLFLFGPLAGVVVDRVDRRRVMVAADCARAVLALGFLAAAHWGSLPLIYLVGASLFAVSAFFNVARRASIPNIARGADQLITANALSSSTTASTIAVGSALGGLLSTFIGRDAVFIFNSVTFIVSAWMISRIRTALGGAMAGEKKNRAGLELEEGGGKRIFGRRAAGAFWRDFREGLKYVRSHDVLRAIFVVGAGWGLGNGVARALYSIFGARLGLEAATGLVARPTDFGISVLFAAMGLGGVIGSPIARRSNAGAGEALASRMGRTMVFDGCCLVIFTLMPGLWSAAAVLVVRDINFSIWWTAKQTIIMSRTEDRYAGRVFASYETLTTLMMVGAMLAAGASADRFGIRPVAALGGLIVVLSGATWFLLRSRQRHSARAAGKASEL
ncbi:MAG TPA: MFS transporter [Pyrinomonadaceae bacterium]|nr:MFS transporter [Pyrinomonadaceae bacterium]